MIVLSWMWEIVKSVLNGIAKVVVFALILVLVLVGIGAFSGDGIARNTVLELDLRQSMEDKSSASLLDLGEGKLSIMDVVMGLDRAARDARVKGIFLRVGTADLSVPKAEELRDALKHFKESGKFVIAHSQSFYSNGLGDYTAAAGADQIWMQPVSTFFSAGTSSTTLFFKGLFDKVNAVPQFVQRYEYKNAANVFTQTDFTPPHREASLRVLQSWYDSATAEASADRKLD
ncbi:MAG TPA: S49 family peptidase, partial [Micropepsaceae bacterium]|nr:S49 family peptidase [Micropepsaceae bacterium]